MHYVKYWCWWINLRVMYVNEWMNGWIWVVVCEWMIIIMYKFIRYIHYGLLWWHEREQINDGIIADTINQNIYIRKNTYIIKYKYIDRMTRFTSVINHSKYKILLFSFLFEDLHRLPCLINIYISFMLSLVNVM